MEAIRAIRVGEVGARLAMPAASYTRPGDVNDTGLLLVLI